jgi:N,N'-diacetyllegionaminate synthase
MTASLVSAPIVIAEIAQAHDGSLGMAHKMIDCVARAGNSHIKFQMHFADHESTRYDKFRTHDFPQDISRHNYWKRIEFTEEQWAQIFNHCTSLNLETIVSPFSDYAVDICERLGVQTIKIGSGEVGNLSFLKNISRRFKSYILSTGMSTWNEIDVAFETLTAESREVAILQCTTEYPCPLERVGLNNIELIKHRYKCRSGLSDHSGKISPSLTAYAQGFTDIIELHVGFSRDAFGPDSTSSITFEELGSLNTLLSEMHRMLISPTNKDAIASEKNALKSLFGRSLYFISDLPKGTVITKAHMGYKKPGGYLTYDSIDVVLGRKLLKDVVYDQPLTIDLLE